MRVYMRDCDGEGRRCCCSGHKASALFDSPLCSQWVLFQRTRGGLRSGARRNKIRIKKAGGALNDSKYKRVSEKTSRSWPMYLFLN